MIPTHHYTSIVFSKKKKRYAVNQWETKLVQVLATTHTTFSLAYAWDRSHSPGAQSSSGGGRAPLGKPEGGSASHSDSRRA